MAKPGGGLQLGGGGGLQLGSTLSQAQQQQQQQPLQLSMAGRQGLPTGGLGTGLTGLTGTQPVGLSAPGAGVGLGLGSLGGMPSSGLGLGLGTSTAAATSSAAQTGLTGLQLGQTGLAQMKPPGTTSAAGLGGLHLSGLGQGQMKAPQLGQQTGLTSQTGLPGQTGIPPLQTQAVSSSAGLTLGIKPQPAMPGMQGGSKPPPPYIAPTTGLSAAPTSAAVSGLSGLTSKLPTLGTTAGVGLGLPKPTTAQSGLTGLTSGTSTTTTGLTGLTGAGAAPAAKKYTYKELETLVNKWSVELQDQEKVFLQQSNQVNAWDRMLAESGDKVAELNEEVQRVKAEQTRVDSELDLIQTQQQELEELLSNLEKDLDQTPTLGVSGHYADMQRTKTFKMAENIDSELKRMGQDLKEIIEQMNSANSHQEEDSTFQQIVKILNAHTDSLGWIDRETALLRQKVDDVAKVTEYRKREQERSFRLAFTQ